jgi:hypothetical protein
VILKEKNETLERAISSQFLQKSADNIHKSEIAELEKRLKDTIHHYTKQIDSLDYELRASRTLCEGVDDQDCYNH